MVIRVYLSSFNEFHGKSIFSQKVFYLKSWSLVMIAHRKSEIWSDWHNINLRAIFCFFHINWQKSLVVPCFNVPFFILLAFCYFMVSIMRKIYLKTGSHSDSKIDSAMLKRVESKKCTLSIRHHYEAVSKIYIDARIWIFGIVMWLCQYGFSQTENISEC